MNAQPSVALIIEAVSEATGVRVGEITSARRSEPLWTARRAVYLLAAEMTDLSFPRIAHAIGERDHTTVLSGKKKAEQLYAEVEAFRDLVDGVRLAVQALMLTDAALQRVDPDPTAVAHELIDRPHIAGWLRVSARDTKAMALRLVALEAVAGRTVRLLRLVDTICTGDIGVVRRAELARETTALIQALAAELTDLNIREPKDGKEEQDRSDEHPRAAE